MGKGKNKSKQPQPIVSKSEIPSKQQQTKLSISKLESEVQGLESDVKELEQELEILMNSLQQKAQQLSDKRGELDALRLKDIGGQLSKLLKMGDTEGIEQWIIANRNSVPRLSAVIDLYCIANSQTSIFIKLDYAVQEVMEFRTEYKSSDLDYIRVVLSDPNLMNARSFDKSQIYVSLVKCVSEMPLHRALSLADTIMAISDAYKEQFIDIIFQRIQNLDMHYSLLEFAKKVNDGTIEYGMQEAFKTMLTESAFSYLLQPWMVQIRIPVEEMDELRKHIVSGKEWYLARIAELQACNYKEKQEVVEVVDVNQQIDYKAKLESKPTQFELDELLRTAVTYEDLEAVKLLISNDADPFMEDNYGLTALEIAVSHFSDNQIEIVRAMIHGASVTPYLIDLAKERNNIELLSLFKQMAVEQDNKKVITMASTALDTLDEANKLKASIAAIPPRLPLDRGKDKEWPELG